MSAPDLPEALGKLERLFAEAHEVAGQAVRLAGEANEDDLRMQLGDIRADIWNVQSRLERYRRLAGIPGGNP